MSQSKTATLVEVTVGLLIGMAVSVALGHVIYPIFGHSFTFAQNFSITVIFTIVSFIRSYFVRRGFNYLHKRGILK